MFEKYDGVRVFWDGKHLYIKPSRLDKIIVDKPQSIIFPSIPFEGELW
jgi:hypothetical protein